ncbi:hypothetical protein IVA80_20635 [Bradyrhizobium sp. 139]|uniref:hypothetical protein n=1 Tax=Bradyrhizobium sp. 139 TaxID=2782616 RepID=UPI001FFAC56E|nr:hypothetical protein [Bradyrhizobium sp. 139]MCK1743201.1 hypothetical protein [Bradyrhizobium sp. 139]
MHAAARQFNTTPKMVAKWVERPHNLRNVLAALASMWARRSLPLSICRLQNTSTYIEQRNSL